MRNKNLLAVAAGLVACVLVVWSSKSIQGGQKKYELRPQVTIPEYRTDTARAIDAYERLMNRYMSLTERNLIRIETKLGNIVKKLDSIDRKLTELSARMTKIEKTLVTSQAKPSVEGEPHHKKERLAPQKKRKKKLSPSS